MKWKIALLFAVLFLSLPRSVYAKKKLLRSGRPSSASSYGAWVKPKLRADHQALLLVLGGMDQAQEVTYQLTYMAGDVPQGVSSVYDAALGNTQTELVFGTCSGTNCTYHQEIADMILEIKIVLNTGKTLTQRYQINL